MEVVPVIDMAAYLADPDSEESRKVIQDIFEAASTWGFFVLTGTSISNDQELALMKSAQEFFALPLKDKMALDLAQGSVAWRGYMPLGGEQTHGHQDWKKGLYIGPEHAEDHPLFGMPLHGRNRFPDQALPNMRTDIMAYLEQATELGKTLTDIISEGLGLGKKDLRRRWLDPEPVVLFRCFKYAPVSETAKLPSPRSNLSADVNKEESFGIGEHTDFGYLTLLKVDSAGLQARFPPILVQRRRLTVLQVLSPTDKWVDVPVIEGALVVNVGDMLDQLTHGRFCSRPHRVRRPRPGASPRFSIPLFFDFSWNTTMERLPLDHLPPLDEAQQARARSRWAKTTFRKVDGKWCQYLARKVQKVFPDLALPDFEPNAASSTRFTRVVNTAEIPT